MATLIIEGEGIAPLQIELEPGTYAFGSAAENALVIEHSTLSPHHADLIVLKDGRVEVADAGSETGLCVGGEPVAQAVIAPGQSFQAGGVRFTLVAPTRVALPPRIGAVLPRPVPGSSKAKSVLRPTPATFLGEIPDAFVYPFRGEAYLYIVIVVALTLLEFFISSVLSILGPLTGLIVMLLEIVIGCYLIMLWQQIVATTSNGDDRFPDFPQVSLDWGENLSLYLQYIALVMICFLPVFLVRFLNALGTGLPAWTLLAGVGLGCVYFPMAFLGFVLTDSLAVLSPVFILTSIMRRPGDYWVIVLLLGLALGSAAMFNPGGAYLPHSRWAVLLFSAITGGLGLYLAFVWMRLLGLFYRRNRDRLAWV